MSLSQYKCRVCTKFPLPLSDKQRAFLMLQHPPPRVRENQKLLSLFLRPSFVVRISPPFGWSLFREEEGGEEGTRGRESDAIKLFWHCNSFGVFWSLPAFLAQHNRDPPPPPLLGWISRNGEQREGEGREKQRLSRIVFKTQRRRGRGGGDLHVDFM